MSDSPWTKIYWNDLIGATADLSAEEFGVYVL